MDDERWHVVDALFDAALALPTGERRALLDRECAGDSDLRRAVERLLTVEVEARSFLSAPAQLSTGRDDTESLMGLRIDRYRLLRPLGHGGMGTVYLARREDDYQQEVAIKLVRPSVLSPGARRRLRAERQALARLEHPNIARLYDGGSTPEGLPYLVMERVVGLPLDRYCDEHRLDVPARLQLVLQLLSAVAHAHHHLRVHCDIKPSNVLVGEDGVPKLLDFGIAKLLSPEEGVELTRTRTGARPMTLAYASPEQVRGEAITTATDLYALGVVLAELLTGRLPYALDGDPALDLPRAIVTDPPLPLDRLVRSTQAPGPKARAALRATTPRDLEGRLRGDLSAIVAKAMRKEPARRYASAEAFADDLYRYLEARPVLARRGSWRYRGGRFLRRLVAHPDRQRRRERWTWGVAVLVLAGVIPVARSWQQDAACPSTRSRVEEVWSAASREAVRRAFLATGSPLASDSFERVAPFLDTYSRRWHETGQEVCEAVLVRGERSARFLDLGRLCLDGRLEEMRALVTAFSEASTDLVIEAVPSAAHLGELAACTDHVELAALQSPPGDPGIRRRLAAIRVLVEKQRLRQDLRLASDLEALRGAARELEDIGYAPLQAEVLHLLGRAEAYETETFERGVERLEKAALVAVAGGDRPSQARIALTLVQTLAEQEGDFERAEWWRRFAESTLQALPESSDGLVMEAHTALGQLSWQRGDSADAEAHYRRGLELANRLGDRLRQTRFLNNLGMLEGAPFTKTLESIRLLEEAYGPLHPSLAPPLVNLAASLSFEGRYTEALPYAERSREVLKSVHGERYPDLIYPQTLIAQILLADDRIREAQPAARLAVRYAEPFGEQSTPKRDAHTVLAEALLQSGDVEGALAEARVAATMLPPGIEPGNWSRLYFLRILGDAERRSGQLEAAVVAHRGVLENLDEIRRVIPALTAGYLLSVGRTWLATGRAEEAGELLEEGVRVARRSDRALRAELHLELARLVADEHPARAQELAMEAKRSLLSEERDLHRQIEAAIDEWLAASRESG